MHKDDERVGGTYLVKEDGTRELVGEPTRDHPEGNAARDADGRPIDAPPAREPAPPPANVKPMTRRPRPTTDGDQP